MLGKFGFRHGPDGASLFVLNELSKHRYHSLSVDWFDFSIDSAVSISHFVAC